MRERGSVIYQSTNQNYNDIFKKINIPIHTNICINETADATAKLMILNTPICPLTKPIQLNNEKNEASLDQIEKYGKCDPCYMRKYLESGLQKMYSNDDQLYESNACLGEREGFPRRKCLYKKKFLKSNGRWEENIKDCLQNSRYKYFLDYVHESKTQPYNVALNNDIKFMCRNGFLHIYDQRFSKTWLECEIMKRMNTVDTITKYSPIINCSTTSEFYFQSRIDQIRHTCQERKTLILPVSNSRYSVNSTKSTKQKKKQKLSIITSNEESNFPVGYDSENLDLLGQEKKEKKSKETIDSKQQQKDKILNHELKKGNKRKVVENRLINAKNKITEQKRNKRRVKKNSLKEEVGIIQKTKDIEDETAQSSLTDKKDNKKSARCSGKVMHSGQNISDKMKADGVQKMNDKNDAKKTAKKKTVKKSELETAENTINGTESEALTMFSKENKEILDATNTNDEFKDNDKEVQGTNVLSNTNENENIGIAEANRNLSKLSSEDQGIEQNAANENIDMIAYSQKDLESMQQNTEVTLIFGISQEETVIGDKSGSFKERSAKGSIESNVLIDGVNKGENALEASEKVLSIEEGSVNNAGKEENLASIIHNDKSYDRASVTKGVQISEGEVVKNDEGHIMNSDKDPKSLISSGKKSGKISDASGKISDASGKISDARGKISDASGKISDASGKISDGRGKISDARGKISDAGGIRSQEKDRNTIGEENAAGLNLSEHKEDNVENNIDISKGSYQSLEEKEMSRKNDIEKQKANQGMGTSCNEAEKGRSEDLILPGTKNVVNEFSDETESNYDYKNKAHDTSESKILCLTLNDKNSKTKKLVKKCDRFPETRSHKFGMHPPEIRVQPGFITLKSMDLIKKLPSQTACLQRVLKHTPICLPQQRPHSEKNPSPLNTQYSSRIPFPSCSSKKLICKTEPIISNCSRNKNICGITPVTDNKHFCNIPCPKTPKLNFPGMYDMKCLLNPRECYKNVPK